MCAGMVMRGGKEPCRPDRWLHRAEYGRWPEPAAGNRSFSSAERGRGLENERKNAARGQVAACGGYGMRSEAPLAGKAGREKKGRRQDAGHPAADMILWAWDM